MDVRQVRPTDAPLVLSLALDRASHLVSGRAWPEVSPVTGTMARTFFPVAVPGRSWLAVDGGSAALLEAQPRQYVIGWDITRLVVRGDAFEVLAPVIQAATAHLQSRGVPRLFARCSPAGQEALAGLEFHGLAREYVVIGPEHMPSEDMSLPVDSRYRAPSDAWPLHQLEYEITPSLVRQLEGLTSLEWAQAKPGPTQIVVERDGRIVAWIGWGRKAQHGWTTIGLLLHPDHKDLGRDLLHHALKNLPPGGRPVARVRDYHPEALTVCTDAGFKIAAEETLMVKHAGVELARVAKGWVRVAGVPSIRAFPIRLGLATPDTITTHRTRTEQR